MHKLLLFLMLMFAPFVALSSSAEAQRATMSIYSRFLPAGGGIPLLSGKITNTSSDALYLTGAEIYMPPELGLWSGNDFLPFLVALRHLSDPAYSIYIPPQGTFSCPGDWDGPLLEFYDNASFKTTRIRVVLYGGTTPDATDVVGDEYIELERKLLTLQVNNNPIKFSLSGGTVGLKALINNDTGDGLYLGQYRFSLPSTVSVLEQNVPFSMFEDQILQYDDPPLFRLATSQDVHPFISALTLLGGNNPGDSYEMSYPTYVRFCPVPDFPDTVWGFGENSSGQLGEGTTQTHLLAVPSQALKGIIAISTGGLHTLAIQQSGIVWTWGNNAYGQLGDGTTHSRTIPQPLGTFADVTEVSAGLIHSLVLKSDGTVWAWGNNDYGQLGDGTTASRSTPGQVSDLTHIIAISTSANAVHNLAIRSDGTVWAWGNNDYGQLGDGTTSNRLTPVQVQGLHDIIAVSTGTYHSIAVRSDGTVWTWGNNVYGQLGDGTTSNHSMPVQVRGLDSVQSVSAGYAHTLAVKEDGTVWGWGWNFWGQIGDSTLTDRLVPTPLPALSGVTVVAAGFKYSMALRTDGTVWTWGRNFNGELGNGSLGLQIPTPQKIPMLANTFAISAGVYHSLTLCADHSIVGTVTLDGCVNARQMLTFSLIPLDGSSPRIQRTYLAPTASESPTGTFALLGIPPIAAFVYIKGDRWLTKQTFVDTTQGGVVGIDVTLHPGDLNRDNVIDLDDLVIFFDAYGSSEGDANWNERADLTCEGGVDLDDLVLFFDHYGETGDF